MSDSDTDAPGDDPVGDDSVGDDATDEADGGPTSQAVLLDVLPTGRPDDGRPGYQKSPIAYGLGVDDFRLYEVMLAADADVSVSDRIPLDDDRYATRYREIDADDLTRNAAAEIEYAVADVVESDERRFVDFFNEAGPITLRLHQLNLLPGIGKKLRNKVIDERKRGPFESFTELTDRVSGLHRPREVVIERIVEEVREDDLKYRTFVGRNE
ncbi:DUF655 domain-containing protein [Halorubrum sp. JWXQ-INN 858]|uniref:DUF655 domain-containing protein n=1 Tax=Halorubrum sp. JWXQ-INN 858 TaxID=2690782 RepID=UPI0013588385|nr:DUF655 domain-containing protein [Halorubrum sp. JWXQ-INN 858]MWV64729.1 DUF655 domain-containing protein [Halorubrum sp. JWXQ-INN 858]